MLSTYAKVLRTPGARSFSSAGALLRMPISTVGISTIVLVRATYGNYTLAGVVSAVGIVALAVGAPVLARWVDRYGQRAVMAPASTVMILALIGVLVCCVSVAPPWLLVIFAGIQGATQGSPGALVRARWSAALKDYGSLQTAFALESAIDEFAFIVGPILATVLGTAVHPTAGLVLSLVAQVVGSVWFLSQTATQPTPVHAAVDQRGPRPASQGPAGQSEAGGAPAGEDAAGESTNGVPVGEGRAGAERRVQNRSDEDRRSLLFNPVIIVLALTYVGAGAMFGSNDLGDIAFTGEHGHPELAGVVTGAFALGSFAAALVYGSRVWTAPLWKLFGVGVLALAIGSSTFLLAHSIPVLMLATVITGLAIAPTMTNVNTIVAKVVAPQRLTEGLTWMSTAMNVGTSLGAAVAGRVVDLRGSRGAFELVIVFAWLMVVLMLIGLPKLRKATTHPRTGPANSSTAG